MESLLNLTATKSARATLALMNELLDEMKDSTAKRAWYEPEQDLLRTQAICHLLHTEIESLPTYWDEDERVFCYRATDAQQAVISIALRDLTNLADTVAENEKLLLPEGLGWMEWLMYLIEMQ